MAPRQQIQEDLVSLFLRLNGYLTTGLIIHSPSFGKNQTELDIIAIRLPFHNQEDRNLECLEYLQIPENTIDIIIGEVKSGNNPIQFNKALRENKIAIEKLIKWIGAFHSNEISSVIDLLEDILKPKTNNNPNNFISLTIKNTIGLFSIRPMLFSLDKPMPKKNQMRYVNGQTILDFIWNCFRPENARIHCSTSYDYNLWGQQLLPIVQYIKDPQKTSVGDINDFYKHFNC